MNGYKIFNDDSFPVDATDAIEVERSPVVCFWKGKHPEVFSFCLHYTSFQWSNIQSFYDLFLS